MTSNHADRGRDVSQALTEVRTVLTRAETARADLIELSYAGNRPGYRWDRETRETHCDLPPSGEAPDPDTEDMVAALDGVIASLARWRKTGRPRRG